LNCGEEGLDWEVTNYAEKGLSLRAMRFFPSKSRILVDAIRPRNHTAVLELMPLGGTIQQIIDMNGLGDGNGGRCLCLRISRVNHDCNGNTSHYVDDDDKRVVILFAERDINPGEEICFDYLPFNDPTANFAHRSSALKIKWGITCRSDCVCLNEEMKALVAESRHLDESIYRLAQSNAAAALRTVKRQMTTLTHSPTHSFTYSLTHSTTHSFNHSLIHSITSSLTLSLAHSLTHSLTTHYRLAQNNAAAALRAVKRLLTVHDSMNSSWIGRSRTLYDGFQIAIMQKKTLPEAKWFIKQACDIQAEIFSEEYSVAKRYQELFLNPEKHRNYLIKN
jgi:hypothetical protein